MEFHLKLNRQDMLDDPPTQQPRAAQVMQPILPLSPGASLFHAAQRLAETRLPALPVTEGACLIGWLREQHLSALLAENEESFAHLSVVEAMDTLPRILSPTASLLEMQQALLREQESVLPVASEEGYYHGCVTQANALAATLGRVEAPRMGGMATPLGVYLTTGHVSGGAGILGLFLAGVTMATILFIVQMALLFATLLAYRHLQWPLLLNLLDAFGYTVNHVPHLTANMDLGVSIAAAALLIAGFMLLLRFFPLMTGYHAAEHQTVNAVEQGEPLTPEAVARMPRVHPRCGTNLLAFLYLTYLGVAVLVLLAARPFARHDPASLMLFVVVFVIVFLLNWKRIGGWLQAHLTTRPATRREIESGIRAGKEVLRNHFRHGSMAPPRPLQRLWHMGLTQILLGALLMSYLLQLVAKPLDQLAQSLVK